MLNIANIRTCVDSKYLVKTKYEQVNNSDKATKINTYLILLMS